LSQGFLVYFESELLKRAHKNFDFRNGRSVEVLQVAWIPFLMYHLFQHRKLLSCCSSRVLQVLVFSHIPFFVYHEQSGEFCTYKKGLLNGLRSNPLQGSHSTSDSHQPYCNYCSGTGTHWLQVSKLKAISPSTGRRGEACWAMRDISSNGVPWSFLPIARWGRNIDVSSWWAGWIYFAPTECHVWIPFQKKARAPSIPNIKWVIIRIDSELIIRWQSCRIILYQRLWDGNPSSPECWLSVELGFEGHPGLLLWLLVDQVTRCLDHVLDLLSSDDFHEVLFLAWL
jgi:hypothetical protein